MSTLETFIIGLFLTLIIVAICATIFLVVIGYYALEGFKELLGFAHRTADSALETFESLEPEQQEQIIESMESIGNNLQETHGQLENDREVIDLDSHQMRELESELDNYKL